MESLARLKFRNQVVVIGIEPFCHFHRACIPGAPTALLTTACLASDTARHRKVSCQAQVAAMPVEPPRHGSNEHASVEDVIVETEIIGRYQINPRGLFRLPILFANALGNLC